MSHPPRSRFFFLAAQSACTGLKSGEKQPLLAQMRADAATSPKAAHSPSVLML